MQNSGAEIKGFLGHLYRLSGTLRIQKERYFLSFDVMRIICGWYGSVLPACPVKNALNG
jgi:hypothetical protein